VTSFAAPASDEVSVSFVIPVWHDRDCLGALLPRLEAFAPHAEIIVVTAGSDTLGDLPVRNVRVQFTSVPEANRGLQMNQGASLARGEVLVFQHADTEFTKEHFDSLNAAMRDRSVVGGAFYRKFDERHPRLMWLESFARWRTRHGGTLYGDQSIFVRRDVFERLGGFAPIRLMEDVQFTPRLRRAGKLALLDPPLRSSARHHQRRGAWRRSIQNGLLLLLYKAGVSPETLHRWYYGDSHALHGFGADAGRSEESSAG